MPRAVFDKSLRDLKGWLVSVRKSDPLPHGLAYFGVQACEGDVWVANGVHLIARDWLLDRGWDVYLLGEKQPEITMEPDRSIYTRTDLGGGQSVSGYTADETSSEYESAVQRWLARWNADQRAARWAYAEWDTALRFPLSIEWYGEGDETVAVIRPAEPDGFEPYTARRRFCDLYATIQELNRFSEEHPWESSK